MAQTLMARLPWLFELVLGSLGTNPIVADFVCVLFVLFFLFVVFVSGEPKQKQG